MEGYDLLMIFWSVLNLWIMAYQDYRKWITSNEANKRLSLREIFSIFGQGNCLRNNCASRDYFLLP